MSMIRCSKCSNLIDTDEDWGAFSEDSDDPVCEPCREKAFRAAYDEYKAEYDITPLAERDPVQYAEDMRLAGRGHLLKDGA